MKEFNDSSEAIERPEALRENARRDGYLFFRSLIPREDLLEVRRLILEVCRDAGWLAEGPDLMDGVARPGIKRVEGWPEFEPIYDRIQKLEPFHALALSPKMLAMYDRLFGEPTLAHPRNIARVIFPDNTLYTTPSHQDYIHIHGDPETYTSWIPLSDCPTTFGSLAVMAGSHRAGIFETHSAYGAGGRGIDTDALPYEWHGGDFRLGDALVFHSHAVHRALNNESPDRIRLSVDYRYQAATTPVGRYSLLPHHARLTWDKVYADWAPESPYRRYWERLPLDVIPE